MDPIEIQARLRTIHQEHGDLDAAIAALQARAVNDQLQIARLKRKKLRLKDEIAMLQDALIPDIIA